MAAPAQARRIELARQSLARLLFDLLRERFTGTLELEQPPGGRRTMRLRGGMPVHFDWVLAGTRIAELLGSRRAIEDVDLDGALAAAQAAGQRLGEVLRERGLAGEADVLRAMREQCLKRAADAFRLRSGTAIITPDDDLEPELLQVNVLQLVHRGVTEHYDAARVREELGTIYADRVRPAAALARHHQQFRFLGEDTSVMAVLLSGKPADACALARLPGTSEQRVAQLLCILHACRMLETHDVPATAVPSSMRPTAELTPLPVSEPLPTSTTPLPATLPTRRMEPDEIRLQELAAFAALDEGRTPRAREILEKIGRDALGPDGAAARLWCAFQQSKRTQGDAIACEMELAQLVADNPGAPRAHFYRGFVLILLGRRDQAVRAFERAHSLDARLVDAQRQARSLAENAPSEASGGRRLASGRVSRGPQPQPDSARSTGPHPLWSGGWRAIWIVSGVAIAALALTNLVVRFDW